MRCSNQIPVSKLVDCFEKRVNCKATYAREVEILEHLSGVSAPRLVSRNDTQRTFRVESAGRDLASLLLEDNCTLNIEQIKRILRELLLALREVHNRNICHYDVTPRNVCIDGDLKQSFRVKLIDFGLSFFVNRIPTTHLSDKLGTPSCLSPEHLKCRPELGTAADIFCAGITILQVIQGGDEFLSLSLGSVSRQLDSANERIPNRTFWRDTIPGDLLSTLKLMLSTNPEERTIAGALQLLQIT